MIRIVIVDDEAGAGKALESIIKNFTEGFTVLARAETVTEGLAEILKQKPDILLLDINLNEGTGFDILKQINNPDFKIIFVTAYDEFAIEAIKFSAFDYLLKPINPEELISVLYKAKDEIENEQSTDKLNVLFENLKTKEDAEKKIVLKTADSIYIESVKDIIFCKADNNYTEIHTVHNGRIVVSSTLKYQEKILGGYGFLRCHQSYLANAGHIVKFDKRSGGFLIMSNKAELPVSSSRKSGVLDAIAKI